ncbi:glycine cleavage system H protein 2 [Betaproteobacteria bacterium]|nr:glycine cleavage system H protein 2 [Betaproteobacteria bacterium]GHU43597.1 glycine cleavage system H protein 2 [Betaproteobacteria bacterium]
MNLPDELKYAATHEWARQEMDGCLTIGITDYAQDLLGDLVFAQLPAVGQKVAANAPICVLESVKTASDVHAPVSGVIAAINTDLQDTPEQVNQDSYAAWLFRVTPDNAADFSALLNAAQYKATIDAG